MEWILKKCNFVIQSTFMFKFNKVYFIAATALFMAEAFIAAFMHDAFIRPVFGDFLIVILVYCGLKSAISISYQRALIISLIFSYVVEALQYVHLISLLGWDKCLAAHLILGSGFSWIDVLAYTLGAATVWLIEYVRVDLNKEFRTICQDL